MTGEDYLMSCLSQYLGDTPGIQALVCSIRNTCASPCFNNLQKMPSGPQPGAEVSALEGKQSSELKLCLFFLLTVPLPPVGNGSAMSFRPLPGRLPRAWEKHVHFEQPQLAFASFPFMQQGLPFTLRARGTFLHLSRASFTWLGSTS